MWLAITLHARAGDVEALSDALLEAGALSVSVEDADAGMPEEQPQFGEPGEHVAPQWQHSRITALLPADTDPAAVVAGAAADAALQHPPAYTTSTVEDENWVRLTQSQFDPIRIDERLWIVPSWHEPPDPDAISIVLDPGMAFGTGSHPTTRLCLQWLCRHIHGGETVLDYGCGSGILAVAAARLGAGAVTGVDIDEQALGAAQHNAGRNGVTIALMHSKQPLDARFDRVVANILANPLCLLAPLLAQRIGPGGRIALSGILTQQAARVADAYRPWLELAVSAEDEGWVLMEAMAP